MELLRTMSTSGKESNSIMHKAARAQADKSGVPTTNGYALFLIVAFGRVTTGTPQTLRAPYFKTHPRASGHKFLTDRPLDDRPQSLASVSLCQAMCKLMAMPGNPNAALKRPETRQQLPWMSSFSPHPPTPSANSLQLKILLPHSFQEKHWGNGWVLKRTMAEKMEKESTARKVEELNITRQTRLK